VLRASLLVLTIVWAAGASAMPVVPLNRTVSSDAVDVKIVCEPDGYCIKRGRKPVARWVYGEGAFFGPYAGPGNYGNPRYRYGWWPYWW
jgi:hypothetical protein